MNWPGRQGKILYAYSAERRLVADNDQDKLNEAKWQAMLPLKSPKSRKGFDDGWPENIAIGVNTDAYQPCERDFRITRELLDVLIAI